MKRFTETTKWSDPWFRRLSPAAKLLWLYLCDNCDQAGVIDLDSEVASVHIGATVDERVIEGLGNRVVTLPCGKLFIPQFIKFQHGTPSKECKAHNPVFVSIEKYSLDRVMEELGKGMDTLHRRVQVKVKVKEMVQETEKAKPNGSPVFSNSIMPDLDTWLLRVNPEDDWEREWWSQTYRREAGAGWKMKSGREIVDWCLRQDSFVGFFRSARDERRAKQAEVVGETMPPEEAQRREEASRARQAAIEQQVQSELRASLMQPRE